MTAVDTSSWIINDNLRTLPTNALQTFVNNTTNAYTLVETENDTFVNQETYSLDGGTYHGAVREYRWDCAQIPFLRNPVPSQSGALFAYSTLAHGKSVRPYQTMRWTASGGQHINCTPALDSLSLIYVDEYQSGDYALHTTTSGGTRRTSTLKLNMSFFYTSITQNFSFPNFNDAQVGLDFVIFRQDNPSMNTELRDFTMATTGHASNVVFGQGSVSGSVIRRGVIGTGEMRVSGIVHIPALSEFDSTNNLRGVFGNWQGNNQGTRPEKLIIASRINSITVPYVVDYSVPRITNTPHILNQVGAYGSGEEHSQAVTGTLRVSGAPVVSHSAPTPESHSVNVSDRIRLTGNATRTHESSTTHMPDITDDLRISTGSISRNHVNAHGARAYNIPVFDRIVLNDNFVSDLNRAHSVPVTDRIMMTPIATEQPTYAVNVTDSIQLLSEITSKKNLAFDAGIRDNISFLSEIQTETTGTRIGDGPDVTETGGGGFLLTAGRRLWRRLGLPG